LWHDAEQRLAVGGAVQRERIAYGGYRAQTVRALNLIGKDCGKTLQNGKIDSLAEFLRKLNHVRPGNEVEVNARGRGKPDQRRAQAHARCRRGGDDELLGTQRIDDSLYSGAGKIYALSDLRQAQSGLLALERTQNARRPRDDLYALSSGTAFRGDRFGLGFFSH
jgi:hypothetical protein